MKKIAALLLTAALMMGTAAWFVAAEPETEPADITLSEPADITLSEPVDITLSEPVDTTLSEPVDTTPPESVDTTPPESVDTTPPESVEDSAELENFQEEADDVVAAGVSDEDTEPGVTTYLREDFAEGIDGVTAISGNEINEIVSKMTEVSDTSKDNYTYLTDNVGLRLKERGKGGEVFLDIPFTRPWSKEDGGLTVEFKMKSDYANKIISGYFSSEGALASNETVCINKKSLQGFVQGKRKNFGTNYMSAYANQWVHYVLQSEDGSTAKFYINGNLAGTVDLGLPADNKIDKIRFVLHGLVGSKVLSVILDEIRVTGNEPFGIEATSLAEGVSAGTVVADFNLLLDQTTLKNIRVYEQEENITPQCVITLDDIDRSRVCIKTGEKRNLDISYGGVKELGGRQYGEAPDDGEEPEIIPENMIPIWDTKEDSSITGTKFTVDDTITRIYDQSARWENTVAVPNVNIMFDTEKNLSGVSTLYIWAYSEKATGADMNAVIYCTGTNNPYFRYTFQVNWTGWKLLELPLADFGQVGGPSWAKATHLCFNSNGWGITNNTIETKLNFEKVWFEKEKHSAFTLTGSEPADGYRDMQLRYGEITAEFSNPLSTIKTGGITLTCAADGETVDVSGKRKNGGLLVNIKGALKPDTEYQLAVSKVYDIYGQEYQNDSLLRFSTGDSDVSFTTPVFMQGKKKVSAMPKGGDLTASVTAYYEGDGVRNAEVVLAVYDANHHMADMIRQPAEFAGGSQQTITATLTRDSYDGLYAKAYVIDDASAGKITAAKFGLLSGKGAAPEENELRTEAFEAKLLEGELLISGKTEASGKQLVVIEAKASGRTILTVPVYTDAEGYFGYRYKVDAQTDPSGQYDIRAVVGKTEQVFTTDLYLTSDAEWATIVRSVNEAAGESGMRTVFSTWAKSLQLDKITEEQVLENKITVCYEQKPYANREALESILVQADEVLKQVNSTPWLNLKKVIGQQEKLLLNDSEDYSYYKTLPDAEANSISMKIVESSPFVSVKAFRTAFSAAVKKYQSEQKKGQQTGMQGGGGSGGSGGGTGLLGGGEVSISNSAAGNNPVVPTENTAVFNDLGDVEWARGSILTLYEKGIIAPAEDAKFRPLDEVSREEFVKLIMAAIGNTDKADSSFSDVEASAWYYPYISGACALGLVNGKEDGSFGVGSPITREEMAVIIYRAMELLRVQLPPADGDGFADADEISGWAKDAVAAMKSVGMISGVGNGRFAPRETATRAQAAKMIEAFINETEEMR